MAYQFMSLGGLGDPLWRFFQSLLPDFVLSFAFFMALTYAVLSRRIEHQRAAIAMSAAVGLALAMGLVWWEYENGRSVRNLGPIAIGLGIILLGMILFQAIRQTGGTWAGAGIALGASLLIGWILGLPWPVATEIIQTLAIVALIVGVVAYLFHRHERLHIQPLPRQAALEPIDVRRDIHELHEDEHLSDRLRSGLRHMEHQSDDLDVHPEHGPQLMQELQKILPAEGWLTERLAQLRARAHLIREGHAHRLSELDQYLGHLQPAARKHLGAELSGGYAKILGIDQRLERLDNGVAALEQRIRNLTIEAREALARRDYSRLYDQLDAAQKLQHHNQRLLRVIEHTEKKLLHVVDHVAQEAQRLAKR